MNIEELVVLLPCHSLEDFPVHHEGDEADGLLGAWSALWHPELIAACGKAPLWFRADAPPENVKRRLVVVPQVCDSLLLPGWPTRAKAEGAHLIRKVSKRADILTAALALLDTRREVEPGIAADFLALGTGYLLVELLTRQMRYMSNLDEAGLQSAAQEGAMAAVERRDDDARQHLKNAFEILYEARERFYPVDNYLVDLTLTAETTLGPALRRELSGDSPVNLLLSGAVLERLATEQPDSLAALRNALDRRTACVVGGDYEERETTLLHPETTLAELRRGREVFQRRLNLVPEVYGRRRQGLSPLLPGLLARLGYEGALHFTLDDGQFPASEQAKTRWEGLDSSTIDCLCRVPLDANRPESFLELSRKIGESMDRDYVATTLFAHWPGAVSPYYDDLRRIAAYVPVLGKFITLGDYFQNTERPGQLSKFDADRYRTTFLRQAIVRNIENPVSWVADALRRRLQAGSIAALATMAEVVRLRPSNSSAELLEEVDRTAKPGLGANSSDLDRRLDEAQAAVARDLAAAVAGGQPAGDGLLIVNPQAAARRELIDVSALKNLPPVEGAVVGVQESGNRRYAVVDVPGMGFAWLAAADAPPAPAKPSGFFGRKGPRSIAAADALDNGEMLVRLSDQTGGIQGVFLPEVRGNRLSQQLSFRLPSPRPKPGDVWRDPDLDAAYSRMVCERMETTIAGPTLGEITTAGQLLDPQGKRLAGFMQRFRMTKGIPLLTIDIELDVVEQPKAEAWGSYYAARFAWSDETADLGRGVFLAHRPTKAKRPESPYYVELETETTSTLIFPCGLPHHLLTGERMLDTLLVSRGETRRQFRLAIGVEIDRPAAAASALMNPPIAIDRAARPASGASGWLFFVDAKNIVATHWESLVEGGRVVGFRVRLMETEGLSGKVALRAVRPIRKARQIDGRGQTLVDLQPGDDKVTFDVAAYEWLELEIRF